MLIFNDKNKKYEKQILKKSDSKNNDHLDYLVLFNLTDRKFNVTTIQIMIMINKKYQQQQQQQTVTSG